MAYTDIDDPSAYFQTTLYTGNDTGRSITNSGNSDLQPDWIWIKGRSETVNHVLFDSVRGAQKELNSDLTEAEETQAQMVTSFNSNGFGMGTSGGSNSNTITYAAWQWKAGTSFTNDASGTGIGTIDSAGSVSTDAGFSIVSWTGTGSAGTIKHGLSTTPSMIIIKNRSSVYDWTVGHNSLGWTNVVFLNLTTASQGDTQFNNTAPTSSVFSIGTPLMANKSSDSIIAYCFAEKQGYLKTGKWTGNGSANGPFSYTGFKPAFILIKRTDVAKNWYINDNLRLGYNVNNPYISPNLTAAETGGTEIDILSNGFKIRAGGTGHNQSGGTYIYMAIAENPFVTSTGIPTTAR